MMKSSRYQGFYNKRLRWKVTAKGDGGHLRGYLFEYTKSAPLPYRAAQFLDTAPASKLQEYSGVIEMAPWAVADELEMVLDGEGIGVAYVSIEVLSSDARRIAEPLFCTLPMRETPPEIDGVFHPEEWRQAVQFHNAFLNVYDQQTVKNQTTCYLTADRENFYAAVLYPVYPGGARSNIREHDGDVYTDEAVEFIFNPDHGKEKIENLYQVIANFRGVVQDIHYARGIGQTHLNWDCPGLEVKKGLYDLHYLLEFKIPFASVGVQDPTGLWGLTVARDLVSSRENATLTGSAFFDCPNMLLCRVDGEAPAITWGVKSLNQTGRYELELELLGGKGDFVASITEQEGEGFHASRRIKGHGKVPADLTGRKIDFAKFLASVRNVRGEEVFSGRLNLATAKYAADQSLASANQATIEHYPFQKKLNVRVPHLSVAEFASLKEARLTLRPLNGGEPLTFTCDNLVANGQEAHFTMPYQSLPNGEFQADAKVLDKSGKVFAEQSRSITVKEYPWLNNDFGKAPGIIVPPFIALSRHGRTIRCLMREYRLAENGLPAQIIADDGELLASPVTLELRTAQGAFTPVEARLSFLKEHDERIEWESHFRLGELPVALRAWMEYDGVVFYSLRLTPEKPLDVQRLALKINVREPKLFHYIADTVRLDNNYRHTDKLAGHGRVWCSQEAAVRKLCANFLPSLWLGNYERGIHFFAESDQGWIDSDQTATSELVRENDRDLALQINFVALPASLKGEHTIEFGMMANPARPRSTGNALRFDRHWISSFAGGFLDVGLMPIDPYISKLLIDRQSKASVFLPYTAGNLYPMGEPEFRTVVDEWTTFPASYDYSLSPIVKNGVHGANADNYPGRYISWTPERVDFMLWRLNALMEKFAVDGVYLDNSYPYSNFNIQVKGSGYIREDGRFQPRCHLLLTREYLKRVATLAHQKGRRSPHLVVHNTDANMPAMMAFAELTYAGEMDIPLDQDHYAVFPFERLDTMLGANYGTAPGMLTMLGYRERARRTAPNRAMWSLFKLYDISVWDHGMDALLYQKLVEIEKSFGTDVADCRFIGHWKNDFLSWKGACEGLKASSFLRPDRRLIYLSNTGAKTVTATFALTDGAGVLTDAETAKPIEQDDGVYRLPIPSHDFRVLLFQAAIKR